MIHWHEGLFLLPQHFQALQRQITESIAAERGLIHRFSSGILDLDLDVMKESVSVRRLSAVMPSGIHLEYPRNVEIPSRHIGAELLSGKEFQLSLGVPLWSANGANIAARQETYADHSAYIYRAVEAGLTDENVGGEKKPVLVRKYNAKLVLDTDDRSNMEVLPLVRLKASGTSGLPQLSAKFCPPLLRLRGWQPVYLMVMDLVRDLEVARDDLKTRLQEGGFSLESLHGNQLGMLLKFRSVQSSLPVLRSLVEAPHASPFEVYSQLASLLGSLAALNPLEEAVAGEAYRPDDLYRLLDQTISGIRSRLQSGPVSSYAIVDLEADRDGVHSAVLTREFLEGKKQFYLCVVARESRDRLSALVVDIERFKLTTPGLVTRPRNGLRLTQCAVPSGAPARQDWHYFRIEYRDDALLWESVQRELRIASTWPRAEKVAIDKLSIYSL